MKNNKKNYYRGLLIFSSIYDWGLGVLFMLFYIPIFSALNIKLPENPSYMLLASAFVFVSGFLYWFALKSPEASRELVKMGAIYKLFYVAVGIYTLMSGILPHFIFVVFAMADFLFMILYIEFLAYTKKHGVV
jgi:hypothetical protein